MVAKGPDEEDEDVDADAADEVADADPDDGETDEDVEEPEADDDVDDEFVAPEAADCDVTDPQAPRDATIDAAMIIDRTNLSTLPRRPPSTNEVRGCAAVSLIMPILPPSISPRFRCSRIPGSIP